MFNEVNLLAKLDSPLFGTLLQAAIITSAVIRSDVVAVRVLGSNDLQPDSAGISGFLFARGKMAPQPGPDADDKFFEAIRGRGFTDSVFLTKQKLDVSVYTGSSLMRSIESHGPIRDTLCLTGPVSGSAWCAMTYFRIGTSSVFADADLAALERFKPAVTRRLHDGFHQRSRGVIPGDTGERLTYDQAISKLSRTEREVLGHLLEAGTERQIAAKIHRSPHTVHVHVKNIYRKIRVNSRHELLSLLQR